MGLAPLEFLVYPQLSTNLVCLYQDMLFSLAWWVVKNFSLGLKVNTFLYP